ncbi:hypothetical protein M426DRAFT_251342 [Hypoxylon sp. CI-4A]|nr:hypothetical protein M426DRAFT_251342 [Hypoxylon sp. CI-4A]
MAYRVVKNSIVDLVQTAREYVSKRQTSEQKATIGVPRKPTTPTYVVPFLKNSRFVGRADILGILQDQLFIKKECQTMAIVGLGGVGKTQVALQFAHWVKENYVDYSIFWVPVLSEASVERAYVEIANELGIQKRNDDETSKDMVCRYLSSDKGGKWLLIVDNADDSDILFGDTDKPGVAEYFPKSENGVVLLTTRTKFVATEIAGPDMIDLEEMSQVEAVSFLKSSLRKKPSVREELTVVELLQDLTFLPLAIAQAAAYLNQNEHVSIQRYLELLRSTDQNATNLLNQEFRDNTRYTIVERSRNAVAATWLISFDQIKKTSSEAASLLRFLSCIEPRGIPQSMLPVIEPEEAMERAIGTLHGYAFITAQHDSELWDMHSLVHKATQMWVRSKYHEDYIMKKAICYLAKVFPFDDWENRDRWRKYMPHALRMLHNADGLNVAERDELSFRVGRCLLEDGRVKEAVQWLENTVAWRKERLIEKDALLLESQHELACAYYRNGQIKEPILLLEHVVLMERGLAEDHPSRLASQRALASAYQRNGQVKEAILLLEHVVLMERGLAEDHPNRLASQHELASAYQSNGQIKESILLLEHVVLMERGLAEDHPYMLGSQHELARAYLDDGQVFRSIALLEHVVSIKERVLAEDHPYMLGSQHELARAYLDDGQVFRSIALLEHVVSIRERVLAEDHPERLSSQHELAKVYSKGGQIHRAISLLEHVVRVDKQKYSEDNPEAQVSRDLLSEAYSMLDSTTSEDPDEATQDEEDGKFPKNAVLDQHPDPTPSITWRNQGADESDQDDSDEDSADGGVALWDSDREPKETT